MVTEESHTVNEIHIVRELVLSLQKTVQSVDEKCDKLGERIGVFSEYMIRTTALEADRNLPSKIDKQRDRIDAIETREAEVRGQIRMLKWLAGFAMFIGAILTIWLTIKQISGK